MEKEKAKSMVGEREKRKRMIMGDGLITISTTH